MKHITIIVNHFELNVIKIAVSTCSFCLTQAKATEICKFNDAMLRILHDT